MMISGNAFAYDNETLGKKEILPLPPSSLSARLGGNATGIYFPMYSLTELPQVLAAKEDFPNVPLNINVNPADGPGTAPSPAWASAILQLRQSGIVVTGYVPTRYGEYTVANVENMIYRYHQFYPGMIDGIMFDQVSSSNLTYYKDISDYARSAGFSYIRANPGGPILKENVPLYNQIAIYEGSNFPDHLTLESRTFFPQYSKDNVGFGATVHSQPAYEPDWIYMAAKYLKWVYITDKTEPNPYIAFPSYFYQYLTELAYIQQPHHYLTVNAVDADGNNIDGIQVWLETQSGNLIKEAFTPCVFSVTLGTQYRVVLANYDNYTFAHWQDQSGNTDRHRILSVTSDETVNGVYLGQGGTANALDLTVLSMNNLGHPVDRIQAWLESPSGVVIKKAVTPYVFSVKQGQQYRIVLANYKGKTFGYWQDQVNNTDRHRIISIGKDTTLFGIYQVNN